MGDNTNSETKGEVLTSNIPVSSPNVSETMSIIERAEKTQKLLDEANAKAERYKNEIEALIARRLLSGKAEAGTLNKSKEELEKEAADKEIKDILARFR
jgi:hypothetical protein